MNKITADHLARRACVYVRQSTPNQVQHNLESQRRQYALVDRARALGWQDIDVIDDDLGISGSGTRRPGFERLLRALCDGQVGAVFSIEASRLARNGRDWHTLLEFCSIVGALLIDAEAVYDPRLTNDRLLLGMKGTISEMEVASFRERAQAAILQKAQRGALIRRVPIGYVKGSDDRIEKDPDVRISSAIDLIFRKFAELGSVRQVFFWLDQQRFELPVVRGPGEVREIVWQPARYHAVLSVLKNPVYAGAYAYGRSKTVVRLEAGQKQVRRQVQRRREDWAVLILDHHEGYIDWDVYQSNQTMIAHNENARAGAVRGSIKHGEALLAGLLRCGHCGSQVTGAISRSTRDSVSVLWVRPQSRSRLLRDVRRAPCRSLSIGATAAMPNTVGHRCAPRARRRNRGASVVSAPYRTGKSSTARGISPDCGTIHILHESARSA